MLIGTVAAAVALVLACVAVTTSHGLFDGASPPVSVLALVLLLLGAGLVVLAVNASLPRRGGAGSRRPDFHGASVEHDASLAAEIEHASVRDEQIRRSIDLVQRANRLASLGLLTTGMLQEVRNPLLAIRAFVELLPARWNDADFRREFGTAVLSEVDGMGKLIDDLLRAARNQTVPDEEGDLAEAVGSIRPLLETQARRKGIELTFSHDASATRIAPHPAQLRQIVMNLVLNAIAASPLGGTIHIGTGRGGGVDGMRAFLTVADSGPGIAPADLGHIFEPFSVTRDEGIGFGLTITRQVVRDHGGTITVESEPDSGTTFRVEFPVAPSATRREDGADRTATNGHADRVLADPYGA